MLTHTHTHSLSLSVNMPITKLSSELIVAFTVGKKLCLSPSPTVQNPCRNTARTQHTQLFSEYVYLFEMVDVPVTTQVLQLRVHVTESTQRGG